MISILVPSRGRPGRLFDFIESVYLHADNPSAVEIIVRLDDDDFENYADVMRGLQLSRSSVLSLNVVWLQGSPNVGMGAMTNECLAAASGNIIMLAGDDLVIRTPGFDTLVEGLMPPDGVALIYGNDLFQGKNLATHPFIGRAAVNCWGGQVCNPAYHAEYIDTHIMDTFCRLERMGHPRVLYVPDLITEHMHYLNGKAPKDSTYEKPMDLRSSSMVYERLAQNREADAQAMKARIERDA